MSKHSRKPKHGHCLDRRGHEWEAWCLTQAVGLGNGIAVGLHPEYSPGGDLLGYWKVMRCSCVCAVLIFG